MTEREKILARVREALKDAGSPARLAWRNSFAGFSANFHARQWLPRVGESFEEQLTLFAEKRRRIEGGFSIAQFR
jgi:hypothetical protein